MVIDVRLCLGLLGLNDDAFGGSELCSFLGKLLLSLRIRLSAKCKFLVSIWTVLFRKLYINNKGTLLTYFFSKSATSQISCYTKYEMIVLWHEGLIPKVCVD